MASKSGIDLIQQRLFETLTDCYRWRSGLAGRALDLRSLDYGFDSHRGQLHNNFGQDVHTCVSVNKQYNLLLVKGR